MPKGFGENSFYASWIDGRLEAFLLYPLRIFVGNSGVGFLVYARTARTRHGMRRALVYARRNMDSTSSVCRVSSRRRTLPPCPPPRAGLPGQLVIIYICTFKGADNERQIIFHV